jgi:hypothetical protein
MSVADQAVSNQGTVAGLEDVEGDPGSGEEHGTKWKDGDDLHG